MLNIIIINPTGKSDKYHNDKDDENKYLIDEIHENLIEHEDTYIRNKEAFLLHHVFGYLRELCDDYEISFYLYNKFKRGTIKKSFKMDFFSFNKICNCTLFNYKSMSV